MSFLKISQPPLIRKFNSKPMHYCGFDLGCKCYYPINTYTMHGRSYYLMNDLTILNEEEYMRYELSDSYSNYKSHLQNEIFLEKEGVERVFTSMQLSLIQKEFPDSDYSKALAAQHNKKMHSENGNGKHSEKNYNKQQRSFYRNHVKDNAFGQVGVNLQHGVADAVNYLGNKVGLISDNDFESNKETNYQSYHNLQDPSKLLKTSYIYDEDKDLNKEMHSYNGNPDIHDHPHDQPGMDEAHHWLEEQKRISGDSENDVYRLATPAEIRDLERRLASTRSRDWHSERFAWEGERVAKLAKHKQPETKHTPGDEDSGDHVDHKDAFDYSEQHLHPERFSKESRGTVKRYAQRRPEEAKRLNREMHAKNGNKRPAGSVRKPNQSKKPAQQAAKQARRANRAAKKAVSAARAVPKLRMKPVQKVEIKNILPKPKGSTYSRNYKHTTHTEPPRIYSTGKDTIIVDKVEFLGNLTSSTSFTTQTPGTFDYNPGAIGACLRKYAQLYTSFNVKKLRLVVLPVSAPVINNSGAIAAQTGELMACVQCNVAASRPTDVNTMMNTAGAVIVAPWKKIYMDCPKNNMFGMFTIRNSDAKISSANMADYCKFTLATTGNVNSTTILATVQLHVVVELIGGKVTPGTDPESVEFWCGGMDQGHCSPYEGNKIINTNINGNANLTFNYNSVAGQFDVNATLPKGFYKITRGYISLVGCTGVNSNNISYLDSAGNGGATVGIQSGGIFNLTGMTNSTTAPVNYISIDNISFLDPRNDGVLKCRLGTTSNNQLAGASGGSYYFSIVPMTISNIYSLFDPMEEKMKELESRFQEKMNSFQNRIIHVEEDEEDLKEEEEELIEKLEEANEQKEELEAEKNLLVSLLSKMQSGQINDLDKRLLKNYIK